MSGTLSTLLGLRPGEKLAVVGCGGKTGLIEQLAQENRAGKVLVLPTTKIFAPQTGGTVCTTLAACLAHVPQHGVQYLGVLDAARGKLCALPPRALKAATQGYDLVLMEADGSRKLPCKGWRQNEPCVPHFATATLGVVPISALGCLANSGTVLRLPAFCALTGLRPGATITAEAMAAMVGETDGMFRTAAGRRMLFINQVESADALHAAKALAALVAQKYPGVAGRIFAGSLFEGRWQALAAQTPKEGCPHAKK